MGLCVWPRFNQATLHCQLHQGRKPRPADHVTHTLLTPPPCPCALWLNPRASREQAGEELCLGVEAKGASGRGIVFWSGSKGETSGRCHPSVELVSNLSFVRNQRRATQAGNFTSRCNVSGRVYTVTVCIFLIPTESGA